MKKTKKAMPDRRARMTRDEALGILAEIVRTPVGEIDEAHPLAQEVRRDEVGGGDKPVVAHVVVKMPNKLDALKIIGAWSGWEKGTEADNKQADAMANLTAFVRSRRRTLARTARDSAPKEAAPAPQAPAVSATPQPPPAPTAEQIASIRRGRIKEGNA